MLWEVIFVSPVYIQKANLTKYFTNATSRASIILKHINLCKYSENIGKFQFFLVFKYFLVFNPL